MSLEPVRRLLDALTLALGEDAALRADELWLEELIRAGAVDHRAAALARLAARRLTAHTAAMALVDVLREVAGCAK